MSGLAFVLGAGSTRGALQAGALEALLAAGLQPDMVAGSSIGAINAAFLARNPTQEAMRELQKFYQRADFADVFTGNPLDAITNLLSNEGSILSNGGLRDLISGSLQIERFSELNLPCYVTATDIDSGELRVFGDAPEDRLLDALMSSAAMLPLFPPYEVNGRRYGDGALKSVLPLHVALERGATAVVALNITGRLMPPEERRNPIAMLIHTTDLLLQTQCELIQKCIGQSSDISIHVIDLYPAQYTSFRDMNRMAELIRRGREQMQDALESDLIDLRKVLA